MLERCRVPHRSAPGSIRASAGRDRSGVLPGLCVPRGYRQQPDCPDCAELPHAARLGSIPQRRNALFITTAVLGTHRCGSSNNVHVIADLPNFIPSGSDIRRPPKLHMPPGRHIPGQGGKLICTSNYPTGEHGESRQGRTGRDC
jgi:hypothetical protein